MATTLPTAPTKTNCDAGTDDPEQALLTDLADHIDFSGSLLTALGDGAQLDVGAGLGTKSETAGTPDKLQAAAAFTAFSGADTLTATHRARVANCDGTFTLSLTAAATLGDGWFCYIVNSGSGTITVDPNGAETIDGAATKLLYGGQMIAVTCNGSAFYSAGLDANLGATINALTEDTAPDGDADYLVTYDASAGSAKKVKPENLPAMKAVGSASSTVATSMTVGSIPTWARRVTVTFDVQNITNTSELILTTSLTATPAGATSRISGAAAATAAWSSDIELDGATASSTQVRGQVTFVSKDGGGTKWIVSGWALRGSNNTRIICGEIVDTAPQALTSATITTAGGTASVFGNMAVLAE